MTRRLGIFLVILRSRLPLLLGGERTSTTADFYGDAKPDHADAEGLRWAGDW